MRMFLFRFALAASLIMAGNIAFVSFQDSITNYMIEQTEEIVPNSFVKEISSKLYLPSYKKIHLAKVSNTSDFETDKALHKILREIALCR